MYRSQGVAYLPRLHTGVKPFESGRRDSNPRPSPWQGDALPLRHFRVELTLYRARHDAPGGNDGAAELPVHLERGDRN